ncbi:MAG: DNA primase [Burkholderiaceae bacterium]|nr:MAG: DNA primase [Burkholderiaceae bacterium]TAM04096.1 MAG: DNA primase [Pusillimonas sp.]
MAKRERPPFVPLAFYEALERTGNFRSDATGSVLSKWTGTHWRALSDFEARQCAVDWLQGAWAADADRITVRNAQAALDLALTRLGALPPPQPGDPLVVPCANGAVHVDEITGIATLKAHDKRLAVRYALTCAYEPGAPRPRFDAFLAQILPDDAIRRRVQEYIGYTLLGDTRFQRAQLWLGTGANGKGVLANIVQALHQLVAAVRLDAMTGFGLSSLIGAQLIFCDEAPLRGLDESTLKSAIAGEQMLIDRKHRDPVTTALHGKFLVLGNAVPAIRDQSIGFWRRWDIIPFTVTIAEVDRDPLLAQTIIDSELSGVLNWALEGLRRLLARGRFDPIVPPAMQAALAGARLETDSIRAWIDDTGVATDPTATCEKSIIYDAYSSWCERSGMCRLSAPRFWARLPGALPGLEFTRPRTMGSKRVRCCTIFLH